MEGAPQYEEFQPNDNWKKDEKSNTLVLALQGFRKEQLKVQLDNYGNLKISGERPIEGNKRARFRKEFRIPENSNVSDIRAKFENGNLNVIIPLNTIAASTKPSQPPSSAPQAQEPPKPVQELPQPVQEPKKVDKQASLPQEDKKTVNGKSEDKVETKVKEKEKEGQGRTSKLMETIRLRSPATRKLATNTAVATVVVLGFGIYLAYKFWPMKGDRTGPSESMLDV